MPGEDRRVDTERFSVRADVGQRRLRALAHDVAQHPGEDQPLLAARHHRRLDEEDIAAGRRPGQTRGHAGTIGALGDLVEKARPAQIVGHVLRRHLAGSGLPLDDVARDFAGNGGDLPFQVAHARLAGVVTHDAAQRVVRDGELFGVRP